MIYSVAQLKELVEPIAKKYNLKALWVFGSYARGEATEESDVDFIMDYTDSIIVNLYDFNELHDTLSCLINKNVDLISIKALYDNYNIIKSPTFHNEVIKEMVKIYEKN
jgi:predicted nucleotidyltransferase